MTISLLKFRSGSMCLSPHLSILLGGFSIEFLEKSIDHKDMYITLCDQHIFMQKIFPVYLVLKQSPEKQSNRQLFARQRNPRVLSRLTWKAKMNTGSLEREKVCQSLLLRSHPLLTLRLFLQEFQRCSSLPTLHFFALLIFRIKRYFGSSIIYID